MPSAVRRGVIIECQAIHRGSLDCVTGRYAAFCDQDQKISRLSAHIRSGSFAVR